MQVTIDSGSGCCFGVVSAIDSAEAVLHKGNHLYCLGDIVHNNKELERLSSKGLEYIDYETYKNLRDTTVLIRAHGEPPLTYKIALDNNITLIDASCPVVLRLQANIRKSWDTLSPMGGQVVIFGRKGHAEVIGLLGQTFDNAIIVSDIDDLIQIDYNKPVHLFAQTTQNEQAYAEIALRIKERMESETLEFRVHQTICRLVANRATELGVFALKHDIILFVSDPKSSNGKYLFNICKNHNPRSYFISSKEDIIDDMLTNAKSAGICGATSTPLWLMKEIAESIQS